MIPAGYHYICTVCICMCECVNTSNMEGFVLGYTVKSILKLILVINIKNTKFKIYIIHCFNVYFPCATLLTIENIQTSHFLSQKHQNVTHTSVHTKTPPTSYVLHGNKNVVNTGHVCIVWQKYCRLQ